VGQAAQRGWFVSFAGNVTFRNAPELREAAAAVPLQSLVAETDAPFMSPHPYRGQPNEPARVTVTVAQLAQLHGLDEAEMARITSANAAHLFALAG
jgi:TatD DNase family protein